MKKKKRIAFFPRTKLGKLSFWLCISGLIIIIILNIIIGLLNKNNYCYANGICYSAPEGAGGIFRIVLSLAAIASVCISFIMSVISIIKFKDFAILLIIPLVIGFLGFLFLFGELFFPH